MTDVFISYKRRVRDRVEAIASRLDALGVDVWFDAELEPGRTFSATISEEVRKASCVLVCWTNDAFPHGGDRQGWVLGEATIGRDRGVLVPVFLEKADLDPPWNTIHTEDLSGLEAEPGKPPSGWRNVLIAIGRLVGRPGLADLDRARANPSPTAIADWARRFPADPVAVPILAAIAVGKPVEQPQAKTEAKAPEVPPKPSSRPRFPRAAVLSAIVFAIVLAGAGLWGWREGYFSSGEVRGSRGQLATSDASAPTTSGAEPDKSSDAGTATTSIGTSDKALLLEASDDGKTGAVPFAGTVVWSKGVDETGNPTLVAKATIPERNMSLDLLIRKNSDEKLPASHLMEVNFGFSGAFTGGSIAGLPGVLLKNEELVQGKALVGASARVVGNSFLFALSASDEDQAANTELLATRNWMDVALIYASGKRAIVTLRIDDAARLLFTEALAVWASKDGPPAANADLAGVSYGVAELVESSDGAEDVKDSGTVAWSATSDAGVPTLIGKVSIGWQRDYSASLVIKDFMMEIDFDVPTTDGGSVHSLTDVRVTNDLSDPGSPLVGYVLEANPNSFVFALSDIERNTTLLTTNAWIEFSVVYASGRRATISIKKDAHAEKLFGTALAAWNASLS